MQSKYLSWKMSHCWNQDGTLFSSVCSVVIGLSIFVAIVSVFCIFRITIMCRKLKKQTQEEKMKLPAQCVIWPIFWLSWIQWKYQSILNILNKPKLKLFFIWSRFSFCCTFRRGLVGFGTGFYCLLFGLLTFLVIYLQFYYF